MNDYEVALMKAKYHNLGMTPTEADQYDIDRKFEQEMSIEFDDYAEREDHDA